MTAVRKLWPLLTATHHYEKTLSNRNRGAGTMIDAPILAYLIETTNGRVLYDVGCEIHVQRAELESARNREDAGYFPDDFDGDYR